MFTAHNAIGDIHFSLPFLQVSVRVAFFCVSLMVPSQPALSLPLGAHSLTSRVKGAVISVRFYGSCF